MTMEERIAWLDNEIQILNEKLQKEKNLKTCEKLLEEISNKILWRRKIFDRLGISEKGSMKSNLEDVIILGADLSLKS